MKKVAKKPVAALTGYALDCAVARALGYQLEPFELGWRIVSPAPGYRAVIGFIPRDEIALQQSILEPWSAASSWALGGPIIGQENIGISPTVTFGYPGKPYVARIYRPRAGRDLSQTGDTPLEAAMRCFVASKFGEEVSDEASSSTE